MNSKTFSTIVDRSAPRRFSPRSGPFALSRGNRYSVSPFRPLSAKVSQYDSYFIRKNATRLLNPFVTSSSLARPPTRHFISRFAPSTLISDSLYQSHKAFHCHSTPFQRRFLFVSIPPSGPRSPFPPTYDYPPFATFALSARFDYSSGKFSHLLERCHRSPRI